MAVTILLVRHGETAWNRGGIFRGTHDVPLNDTGRAQARLAGQALQGRDIDAAYTSPLSRAVETAELTLGDRLIKPVIHEGLTDFCYGDWTGLPDSEVAEKWPQEHKLWTTKPESLRVPGGSTLREVYEAAFGATEQIAARHDGETVALFAHRVVNKLIVLGVLGLALERFPFIRQDNCCINEFHRSQRGYTICTLNDTSHIRQGGTDLLTADF